MILMAAAIAQHTTTYYVPLADLRVRAEHDDVVMLTDDELNVLTTLVQKRFPTIRRGDLINVLADEERYRNDGTHIWDGEHVIALSEDPDEYGTVPRQFVVTETEFSPGWWQEGICHNNYWWASEETRAEALSNITYEVLDCVDGDEPVWYTKFNLQGKIWTVVFDQDDGRTKDDFINALEVQPFEYIDDLSSLMYKGTPPDYMCRVFPAAEVLED